MDATTQPRTLADALPRAEFVEHHQRIVEAELETVWAALNAARWTDLRITAPLVLVRGLARPTAIRRPPRLMDEGGPVRLLRSEPPAYLVGGRIAQPWRLVPVKGPDVDSLDDLARFEKAGWIKYGMDFELTALDAGRTRLSSSTLSQPTDEPARRAFARYWRLIRPFSGLIRRDLLRAIGTRAEAMQHAGRMAAIA